MKKENRKLLLWYTRDNNYKPVYTLYDLVPIMETLGFVPRFSPSYEEAWDWVEFKYHGASVITTRTGAFRSNPVLKVQSIPPTPKLPLPCIDGLHLFTYRAFFEAVYFYLADRRADNVFHLQAIPVNILANESEHWCYCEETDTYYREGSVNQALIDLYSKDLEDVSPCNDISDVMSSQVLPVKEDFLVDDDPKITLAPMDDIIVTGHDHPARQQEPSRSSKRHRR